MVDKDLSTEAADAIEMLLQECQNEHRPTVQQIQEYMELAEELREAGSDEYAVPEYGDIVRDSERSSPEMEVFEVTDISSDEFMVDSETTVAEYNPTHPDDAPVVGVRFPDSTDVYHYPVTRLEW